MSIDLTTASGINNLVNAYKTSEVQRQVNPLNSRKSGYQTLSSAYSNMSSKLDSLKSILSELKNSESSSIYNTKVATSSNTSFLIATASSLASVSNYTVRVNRLAKNDSLVSDTKSSSGTITAEDEYKINVKVGSLNKEITINTGGGSKTYQSLMQSLRDALNNDSEVKNVLSTSVFSPTSSTSRITFTAKNSGSDNKIELTDTQGDLLAQLGISSSLVSNRTLMSGDNAGYVSSAANLDAEIIFNNVTITRGSNVINDLVEGVSFTLKNAMTSSDSDVNVSVANDTSQLRSKIESFVTSFNDIYKYLRNNTSSENGIRGILVGDSSASSLLSNLGRLAYMQVSSVNSGELNLLSQIGITFDSTNGLSISDSATLNKKLSEVPSQVANLFNSSNGVATRLFDMINPYLGNTGYLATRKSSLDKSVTELNDRISSVQARIDKSAESLRSQYEKLQIQLITLINSQGIYTAYR